MPLSTRKPKARLYSVVILTRGKAPQRVRAIERKAGGSGLRSTPYRLARRFKRTEARRLVLEIRRAGGRARSMLVRTAKKAETEKASAKKGHKVFVSRSSSGIGKKGFGLPLELGTRESRGEYGGDEAKTANEQSLNIRKMESTRGESGSPPSEVSSSGFVLVEVLYATTRARSGSKDPAKFYGEARSTAAFPELGLCKVSVPTDRRMGSLPAPSIWKLEFREDPKKHVMLMGIEPLNPPAFFTTIRAHINQSKERAAFVFIHGFKTSFKDAVRRTGQLAYDLHFPGAPVCFSWPAKSGLLDYPADEATIEWATPFLKSFLVDLSERSGVERLHLLAHSMGNRALTRALDAIASGGAKNTQFQEVILAAPDIDAGVFRQLAASIKTTARRVTLYASSNDEALNTSKSMHEYPRAGETGDGIVVVPDVDTIDVSAVKTDLIGHSYYGSNRSVLSDIFNLVRNGLPPERRPGLVEKMLNGTYRYWCFVP